MPSGGQFVGREQKSVTPGNGDAREPRSVGERDQVARERKAAIGKLKRFDARGRGLELGLAGKRIVFRHSPARRRTHRPPSNSSSELARKSIRVADPNERKPETRRRHGAS